MRRAEDFRARSGAASAITPSSTTLNGTVNDGGGNTTVTFDYGTTTNYGTSVAATTGGTISAGSGSTAVSVDLTSLNPVILIRRSTAEHWMEDVSHRFVERMVCREPVGDGKSTVQIQFVRGGLEVDYRWVSAPKVPTSVRLAAFRS